MVQQRSRCFPSDIVRFTGGALAPARSLLIALLSAKRPKRPLSHCEIRAETSVSNHAIMRFPSAEPAIDASR